MLKLSPAVECFYPSSIDLVIVICCKIFLLESILMRQMLYDSPKNPLEGINAPAFPTFVLSQSLESPSD